MPFSIQFKRRTYNGRCENRKQKVQEITEKLEQGIKEPFESEKYKSYLNTMSKFHNYSFNNTILIAMQKPGATLVAIVGFDGTVGVKRVVSAGRLLKANSKYFIWKSAS